MIIEFVAIFFLVMIMAVRSNWSFLCFFSLYSSFWLIPPSMQDAVAKGGSKKPLPSKVAPVPASKKEESSESSESDSENEVVFTPKNKCMECWERTEICSYLLLHIDHHDPFHLVMLIESIFFAGHFSWRI